MTVLCKALTLWAFLPLFITAQNIEDPDRDLFYAIFDDNLNLVTTALEKKAKLSAVYTYERYAGECKYWTPLHAAAAIGNKDVVELLINRGADIHAPLPNESNGEKTPQGLFTPLHIAAAYGSFDVVKFLLERGADINAKANWNRTPLITAIRSKEQENTDIVKLLIENGADINIPHSQDVTALFDAAGWGKKEIAELLLSKGADPNALSANCGSASVYAVTPMFCAVWQQHADMLQLLFDHGAAVNTPDLESSPLHQAVKVNDLEAAAFLVQHDANREMKNKEGKTPLAIAKEKGNAAMIYLLEAGKLRDKDKKVFRLLKEDAFKGFKLSANEMPQFSFNDLNGNAVTSETLRGKVVILNVWATWCGPSIQEMASFNKLLKAVNREDVVVVAVSIDQNLGKVKNFIQKRKHPFIYLHDPEASVREIFGGQVPSTFIIDKKGELVTQVGRSIDWDKKIMKELLQVLADF